MAQTRCLFLKNMSVPDIGKVQTPKGHNRGWAVFWQRHSSLRGKVVGHSMDGAL